MEKKAWNDRVKTSISDDIELKKLGIFDALKDNVRLQPGGHGFYLFAGIDTPFSKQKLWRHLRLR